jgi:hypothetical protein
LTGFGGGDLSGHRCGVYESAVNALNRSYRRFEEQKIGRFIEQKEAK